MKKKNVWDISDNLRLSIIPMFGFGYKQNNLYIDNEHYIVHQFLFLFIFVDYFVKLKTKN